MKDVDEYGLKEGEGEINIEFNLEFRRILFRWKGKNF